METQLLNSAQIETMPNFLVYQEPVIESEVTVGGSPIEEAVRDILLTIGEDPQRQGLVKTPDRVARMYDELTAGYRTDPEKLINGALFDVDYSEMVLVKDIEFYSLCEHHMLPFFGRAYVAYIPDGKVIGLSKIPRIVEMFARRLQVQERMTAEIANFLQETLNPRGVAVLVEGAHMCAMMRGVKKSQASMSTTTMLGAFKDDPVLRSEFLAQVARQRRDD
jgi:GTP cyclohydrolase I